MNAKERVLNRINGKPVDRAPNFNILMGFASKYIDKPYDEFCKDYRVLVEANLRANEYFSIDLMNTMSDPYRETHDFGAKVEFPYNSLPICKNHFIEDKEDLKKLKPFDPQNSKRMLDRLNAISLFKKEVADEYPIMGWIEGTIAETADLRGLTNIMMDFYDEPEMLKEIMNICLETSMACIKAQVDAGADIIGVGDAAASLIGPSFYREWALPYEQKLFSYIRELGAIGRLHICGNIGPILEDVRLSGAHIIDVDWMVDFKSACEKFKGYASACGNFDPVAVVKDGTPDSIINAVNNCVVSGDETTFIMAGCEIPIGTPYENLKAVSDALNNV